MHCTSFKSAPWTKHINLQPKNNNKNYVDDHLVENCFKAILLETI